MKLIQIFDMCRDDQEIILVNQQETLTGTVSAMQLMLDVNIETAHVVNIEAINNSIKVFVEVNE